MSLYGKGLGFELPRAQVGVSRWRRFRASVDWPLVVVVAAICGVGLLNLWSATDGTKHAAKFDQQLRWMFVGTIAFVVATIIDYRAIVRLAWIGLAAAIVALIVVDIVGADVKGSQRWLSIGTLGGQPSELAKLAVVLVLARMLQDTAGSPPSWHFVVPRLAALILPVFLIALQPDLGTAGLLTLIMLSIGFLALRDLWPMVYTLFVVLLAVPVLWESMHGYQKDRVLCFLDPSADPTGDCWHIRQSIIAVGSGKLDGKGLGEGTQSRFNYLPEHWTDFPYSVWAEEWGFIGSVFLLGLYSFLVIWTLNVAMNARDRAGAVLCTGVAAMTFWHVVVNVAMVVGMAPVVGVTLPFVSYGGSSLLTFFLGMGMVASVSLRKHGY